MALGTNAWASETIAREDLSPVFADAGYVGTFAAIDALSGRLTVVNASRAAIRYVPASTFKIPNTLIALETGVVKDADEVFRYDGKPRRIKTWEKDMTLREAIAVSNVPIYQEIARRVGLDRYRDWLTRLDYGNRDPGTALETFWLSGPLAISAIEQARFLARLGQGRAPISDRSRTVLRDIIRFEEHEGRILYAKTGWSGTIGWWTGWIEHGGAVTAFALNMDMTRIEDAPKRITIAKALMKQLGLF